MGLAVDRWELLRSGAATFTLGQCVYPYSKRGRNGKGLLEKIIMTVWGSYHVPVKTSVFLPYARNENEHNAAEVLKKGVKIGFSNEVGCLVWSNGEYKKKNSTDPSVARACGSADTDVVVPTLSHIFATNDLPKFQTATKGVGGGPHTSAVFTQSLSK